MRSSHNHPLHTSHEEELAGHGCRARSTCSCSFELNIITCLFEASQSHAQKDFEHVRCLDGRATAYPAHQRLLNLSSADDLAAGVRLRHFCVYAEAVALSTARPLSLYIHNSTLHLTKYHEVHMQWRV